MPRVLSTDPNAGLEPQAGPRVLSTDPNAGTVEGQRLSNLDQYRQIRDTQGAGGLAKQFVKSGAKGTYDLLSSIVPTIAAIPSVVKQVATDPAGSASAVGGALKQLPDYLKESYGSPERIAAKAVMDPVGMASDVSTAVLPFRAAGVKAVAALDPLVAGAKLGEKAAGAVAKGFHHAGAHVAERGAKPLVSLGQKNPDMPSVGELILKYKRTSSDRGMAKHQQLYNQKSAALGQRIDTSPSLATGAEIFQGPEVTKARAAMQANPEVGAAKGFEKAVGRGEQVLGTNRPLTMREVQNFKRGLSAAEESANAFGRPKKPGVVTGYDAERRAAKRVIEERLPGIKDANRELGEMDYLGQQLARANWRSGNLDLIPARSWFAGLGAPTPQSGLLAAIAAKVGLSPEMVQRYGIGLDMLGKGLHAPARGLAKAAPYTAAPGSILARLMSSHEQP